MNVDIQNKEFLDQFSPPKTIVRDGGSFSAAGTTRRGRMITERSLFKNMKSKIEFLNEELKQLKSLNTRLLDKWDIYENNIVSSESSNNESKIINDRVSSILEDFDIALNIGKPLLHLTSRPISEQKTSEDL